MNRAAFLSLLPLLYASAAMAGTIDAPVVTRSAPDRLTIAWQDADPVDIFQSDRPDARPAAMKLVAHANRDGQASVSVTPGERPYFLLKDSKSGKAVHVAERLLPLEQGSNFRDIGGYPAAGWQACPLGHDLSFGWSADAERRRPVANSFAGPRASGRSALQ